MNNLINAAPLANLLGIQDVSGRPPVIDPEVVPTHLPHVYLYTQKGDLLPQLVIGDSFTTMFGAKSLDPRSPYYNHQSELASILQGAGNSIMVERIVPADIGPKSRLLLSLDIVEEPALAQYQRNADGTFALDSAGAKIPVTGAGATIPGFRAKWVLNHWDGLTEADPFAEVTTKTGSLVNSASEQSTVYPILEFEATWLGAYGNDLGLRIMAPTTRSAAPLNDTVAELIKAYLFRLQFVSRVDSMSSATVVESVMGEQAVDFTFKAGAINTINDTELSAEDILIQKYQDIDTPGMPPQYGPFGRMHLYRDNLENILAMIAAEEAPLGLLPEDSMDADSEWLHAVNLFTATNFDGAPYYTLTLLGPEDGGLRFSENTTLFAAGGSDGTMDFDSFDTAVRTKLTNYGISGADLLDWARYPQSVIYDTGFTMDTKLALGNVIARRKDMWVVVSTQDISQPQNTASEESSLAVSLRTAFRNFPESEMYGTGVCRAIIIGHSGKLLSSKYKGPQGNLLPLTLEFAQKCAAFMSSGDGRWRAGLGFDQSPQNQITMFRDVNAAFKSATVRNKDWDNGLVWVQNYDRRSLFWPAVQTVYDDDSSVLNGAITMMCAVELEKVAQRTWRDLTGNSKLTAEQFAERSNEAIIAATTGRFDDRFVIVPNTFYTAQDEQRGYSWSCRIDLYAPNMKTVGTYTITAHRMSDLNQAA